ncbi:hypothetical protein SAMN05444285_106106 [Draconibacterium orientale]|uniref:RteC protein n=1 Tax=Draconibacterium orientale TaxID=1168034 RepID=X5E4A1_9BACT|nr:hypothetical protein [Draconibacterium orientale]AHW61441.1 hypothetical protein FH5T_01245 [Draconibacterium orientale]SET12930.1 hypothetical protein SAMN05444285_106106 [Draconibacterium orientale]
MNTFIDQFVEVFADNEYKADVQHYCELNGKSSSKELKKYLEKHFRKFKREYLGVNSDRKDELYSTMLASLNRILTDFTPAYKEVMDSNNSSLKELFNVKLTILKRLNEFISSNPTHAELSAKDIVYYFTVKNDFKYKYDIYLNNLYYGLKDDLKYINCTPEQFKMLFRPEGKKRMKTPEPIIWLSAYSHLLHFIKCLVDADFIPNTKKPSFNIIARNLFYEKEDGKYFRQSGTKRDVKDLTKFPYVDIKNMVVDKLNLKTRPSSELKK